MVYFFQFNTNQYFLVETDSDLQTRDLDKLGWLFGGAEIINSKKIDGTFIGPRKEMITPWSTNAVRNYSEYGYRWHTQNRTDAND